MARFEEMVADPVTMSVIVQRVAGGESIKQIAQSREVPYLKLLEWITLSKERSEIYHRALAAYGSALAFETRDIADGRWMPAIDNDGNPIVGEDGKQVFLPPDHKRDTLRVKTRQWLSSNLDRENFGQSANLNVAVKDDRVLDADARLLELARGMAFVLAQASARAAPRAMLSAPVEKVVPAEREEPPI